MPRVTGSLALAYVFLGNYRQAAANYNQAVRFNPNSRNLAEARRVAF